MPPPQGISAAADDESGDAEGGGGARKVAGKPPARPVAQLKSAPARARLDSFDYNDDDGVAGKEE